MHKRLTTFERGTLGASLTILFCWACSGTSIENPPSASSGGGVVSTGGNAATGGKSDQGGSNATGGTPGTGGVVATGGAKASSGGSASGGIPATGGSKSGSGGAPNTGGSIATTGGKSVTGGSPAGRGGKATGGAATGGSSSSACPHVQLKGTDICTIGDSWIQITGDQVTTLENHMKAAGVIPQGDHFDRREVSGSTLASIVGTYNNKPTNCKILVMDGGGIDLFSTPLDPNSSAVTAVVNAFKAFLSKVQSDGYTQHIIYSLYPVIPSTKNLNANMGPGYTAACNASAVDCHLVDLEPLFQGQHFGTDQTHADATGSKLIGDAWWKAMQDNCIAQ